ncbi:hypothetical protein C2G38_2160971 [Gigaspora rosea]|uniref:Uncharacterized protein n=1 Tax=Gigaspora rosea TaxID=44941 RepID=A0A397VXN2_9GLOM|nr:hypothetical protein C2G38_2160971 [Gigaspora rosea]
MKLKQLGVEKVTTLKLTQTSVSEASSSALTKWLEKSLQYSVDTNFYTIEYNNQNKENQKQRAIIEVNLSENEQPDIDDSDIIEQVTNAIGKAGYRSIKDILNYIMPFLINQNILNPTNPSINLRISGDGRNVRRKIKHVMVTCAILDDKTNFYFPNHHYVVVLYPRSENYDSLKNAISLFLNELHELKELEIKINNITWNINLYFSADWKFLCICLGFNGANSYYYCS